MAGGYLWTPEQELFLARCHVKGLKMPSITKAYNKEFPLAPRKHETIRKAVYARGEVRTFIAQLNKGIEPDVRAPEPPPTIEIPDLPADDPKVLNLERRLLAAQDERTQLRAKLTATRRDESLFEFAAHAIEENVHALAPVKIIERRSKPGGTPVDSLDLLSDEHADEKLNPTAAWGLDEYGFGMFRCRLQRWAEEKAEYLTRHLPAHNFERNWIFKLGDGVNGDIHDMKDKNFFGNTIKAAQAVGDAEAQAIQFLAKETGIPQYVVCVSGNHPRRTMRKNYDGPHDNFDYLVASQIATRLADQPNVQIVAPEAWTVFVDVRGHLCALNHGDDMKGTWGIPWYGVNRRTGRVQDLVSRSGRTVRYFFHGHFHQPAQVPAGAAYVRFNGAFPMTSSFATEGLAVASDPAQSMFVVSDKGIILAADIWLRDLEREDSYRAGEWEPDFGRRTILDELEPSHGRIGELDIINAAGME